MANLVVIGIQWGDEGKGKIVDFLAGFMDIVVRFQGGNNAGHTVIVNNSKIISHIVPSGILQGKTCLISNGVVVDPKMLVIEIDYLKSKGFIINPKKLLISDRSHLIMPYHRIIDFGREKISGEKKIGTTGKGIGPTYEDKVARRGIRFSELLDFDYFEKQLDTIIPEKKFYIEKYLNMNFPDITEIKKEYKKYAKKLSPYVTDTSIFLHNSIKKNKKIIFEGAQGTHLDIEHGTYPFVTSSNTVSGNACSGSGIGPKNIDIILGITKAYTTRVGSGPFVSELFDKIGNEIQKKGAEFGATTGRKRRCGWLDVVLLKHSIRVNGITNLVLTKLDILSGINPIRMCIGYKYENKVFDDFPSSVKILEECEPIYEEFPGWKEELSKIKNYEKLPKNAKKYLKRIEELIGVKICILSVGPEREDSIVIDNFLKKIN